MISLDQKGKLEKLSKGKRKKSLGDKYGKRKIRKKEKINFEIYKFHR